MTRLFILIGLLRRGAFAGRLRSLDQKIHIELIAGAPISRARRAMAIGLLASGGQPETTHIALDASEQGRCGGPARLVRLDEFAVQNVGSPGHQPHQGHIANRKSDESENNTFKHTQKPRIILECSSSYGGGQAFGETHYMFEPLCDIRVTMNFCAI
ncbi:hypothetical protein V1282_006864 [Nitrobacteraceae bacterium AZCC 2146]